MSSFHVKSITRKIDTNSSLMSSNAAFYGDDFNVEIKEESGPNLEHFSDQVNKHYII